MIQDNNANVSEDLLPNFQEAILKQRPNGMPSTDLTELRENRYQSHIQHRLTELEGNYLRNI